MYVITNREVLDQETGLDQFGKRANAKGPNELRIADVTRRGKGWQVKFLDDELSQAEAARLIDDNGLDLNPRAQHYASLKVACNLASDARSRRRHILFYVHGYNNDMHDVVEQAWALEKRYGVICIPFSWPANGGGVAGTASYKSDKRDARASTGALERAIQKVQDYLHRLTDGDCRYTVNALFHSMGNYLLKQMLKSSIAAGTGLTFDNVVLAAADTNNLDHRLWVERIQFRKRCFIAINENDFALAASRAKSGSEQLARLGHFLRNLNASNAHYVNFTDASWVRQSHSYFADPARRNDDVREFFQRAFSGESAEDALRFHPEGNWYGFT